ncbi:MAG: hypothetical protein KC635_12070 [Myxococcales bacterium]|nr:hypothetical protein [Myxococcales bacterium]MCB9737075.1 hypothetical protein [Deltaproteobacteria bacterium]
MNAAARLGWASFVFAASTLAACAGTDPGTTAPGGHLGLEVAPLSLVGVDEVCYDVEVRNGQNQIVWKRGDPNVDAPTDTDALCSGRYGDGAGGAISYVGTCDADAPAHSVTLWVDGLLKGGAALTDWQDPCAAGCTVPATCSPNEDTAVTFDITVLRAASQGFFDIAVTFDDIFCSAKVDCVKDDAGTEPLTLLFDADGKRQQTAVAAVACTRGPGANGGGTVLHMNGVDIVCDDGAGGTVTTSLDPTIEGNAWSPPHTGDEVWQYAVFRGTEALPCGGVPCNKVYWNTAIGFDPAGKGCHLQLEFTAAAAPGLVNGATAVTSAAYPYVVADVPLTNADGSAVVCKKHPLNGPDVVTTYTDPGETKQFCHRWDGVLASTVAACVDVPTGCTTDLECNDGNPCTADVCVGGGACQSTACDAPQVAWNDLGSLSPSVATLADADHPFSFPITGWSPGVTFHRTGNAGTVRRFEPGSTLNGTFPGEGAYAGYTFGWSGNFPYIDILTQNGSTEVAGDVVFDFHQPATSRGAGWRFVVGFAGTAGTANEGPQRLTPSALLTLIGRFNAFGTGVYPVFDAANNWVTGSNGGPADGYLFFVIPAGASTFTWNVAPLGALDGTPDQFGFVVGMVNLGNCPEACND